MQAGGQEFDPPHLHQNLPSKKFFSVLCTHVHGDVEENSLSGKFTVNFSGVYDAFARNTQSTKNYTISTNNVDSTV